MHAWVTETTPLIRSVCGKRIDAESVIRQHASVCMVMDQSVWGGAIGLTEEEASLKLLKLDVKSK